MKKTGIFKLNIVFVYLFILSLSGAISYFVYQAGKNIASVNHQLTEKQLPLLNHIAQLKHWLNEHERILYEHYATEDNEQNLPQLELAQQNINSNLVSLVSTFPENEKILQLIALNQKISKHANDILIVLDLNTGEKWDEARRLLAIISKNGRETQSLINNIDKKIKQEIAISNSRSNQQLTQMSSWVVIFSGVVLLIAILVGYYVVQMEKSNAEKRRLALFIEKSPNAIASVNWHGGVESENQSWKKVFSKQNTEQFFKKLRQKLILLKSNTRTFSQWHINVNQEDLEVNIHKIANLDQAMIFVENISDRVAAKKELEFLAYNDPLTGLPNMKKLEMDLEFQLNQGRENHFYLFTVGMKQLKSVTSAHGISVSDALVKSMVKRIQSMLTPLQLRFQTCLLYRFPGAKFNLLLAEPLAEEKQDRLIQQIDTQLITAMDKPLQTPLGSFFLDFQTGCVHHPAHGYSADQLIKNANAALNEAQKTSQKQIVLFDHEISYREQNWYQLENDLRAADYEKEFYLAYQPKIDLNSSQIIAVEALVRWQHPNKGIISPVEFIPIAEETGLIIALGNWVLRKACEQTKKWHKQGLEHLQVAVNVSPSQLLSANFVESVVQCLKEYQLPPEYLEIEITEEVLATDQQTCIDVLNQIKNIGISIAVDDFGTGYSSLGYLNKFPLSKLKVDRSFVTDIDQDDSNHAIVSAIISMSKKLGIKVIAEGIETKEELVVLKALDCDQGQGYLFDKPLMAEEFSQRYLKQSALLFQFNQSIAD